MSEEHLLEDPRCSHGVQIWTLCEKCLSDAAQRNRHQVGGIYLRDLFAALAVMGFCARSGGMINPVGAALHAYEVSDAMLERRKAEPAVFP